MRPISWRDAEGPFGCAMLTSDCGNYHILEGPEGVAWAFRFGWYNVASVTVAKLSANAHRDQMNSRATVGGLQLSWNMGEDGVATLYAKDVNGRSVDLADVFRRPLKIALGLSEGTARDIQIQVAERICATWNATA